MISSVELFSGTGGLALGLQLAGFDHKALYEWDESSCNNINANKINGFPIQDWNVVKSDVRAVDYGSLNDTIRLVSGGPPCQPFSLGGKHAAYNDSRDMFPEAVRAVRELQPHAFVFENVKGLLRKSFSTYFNYIILQLTHPDVVRQPEQRWEDHLRRLEQHHTSGVHVGLNYNVVFRLVNAADYGIPQTRNRVIIVGFRNDINADWAFPIASHSKESLLHSQLIDMRYWDEHRIAKKKRPVISQQEKENLLRRLDGKTDLIRWQTVRDAIIGLPNPQSQRATRFSNHEFKAGARAYIGHSGSVLDEPSKTIKAGAHGVPGGENMILLDDGSLRYYTVRESARLQTFPDEYRFYGSWTESMRQIGNAVPVRLANIIGNSIAHQLTRVNQNYGR